MFSERYEQSPTTSGPLYFRVAISYIAMQIYEIIAMIQNFFFDTHSAIVFAKIRISSKFPFLPGTSVDTKAFP